MNSRINLNSVSQVKEWKKESKNVQKTFKNFLTAMKKCILSIYFEEIKEMEDGLMKKFEK